MLKYHPTDENIILTGGWDNTVQIWDTRTDHAVRRIYGPHICGEALDMDGDVILTGSWRPNKQLQLWDYGSGELIEDLPWPAQTGSQPCALYAAQFNQSKQLIGAGGSGANEAKIIDRASGKVLGSVTGLERAVYTMDFSQDDKTAALGTGDGSIYILNLERK